LLHIRIHETAGCRELISIERCGRQGGFLDVEWPSVSSPHGTEQVARPPFGYGFLFPSVDATARHDVGDESFPPRVTAIVLSEPLCYVVLESEGIRDGSRGVVLDLFQDNLARRHIFLPMYNVNIIDPGAVISAMAVSLISLEVRQE